MFRNICVYRLDSNSTSALMVFAVSQSIADRRFHPCGQTEPNRCGFVPVIGDDFAPSVADGYALKLRTQKRILPASVVNDELKKQIEKIEREQSRKVGSKERKRLKDDVYFSLLPKAFTKDSDMLILVLPVQGLILVESSSLKTAETALNAMRLAFVSLPVSRPAFALPIAERLKYDFIAGIGSSFKPGCDFDFADEESAVKFKGVDVSSKEAGDALDGRTIKKMSLIYHDSVLFKITDDCRLQGVRMSERMRGELTSQNAEDYLAEQQAELHLWAATLAVMVPELLRDLGEVQNA